MANEQAESRRISVSDIQGQKGGRPIVCLTAYSKPMAQWLDPHVDLLLVGDSLAMVIYGMETTRGITLDAMMELRTRLVDMGNTTINVMGDLVGTAIVARSEERRGPVETAA